VEHAHASVRLPGAELVADGLSDLDRRVVSRASLLVSIGAPRLRRLGLTVSDPFPTPELGLYELLRSEHGDDAAHGRYNALLRRLVSFERAAAIRGSRGA